MMNDDGVEPNKPNQYQIPEPLRRAIKSLVGNCPHCGIGSRVHLQDVRARSLYFWCRDCDLTWTTTPYRVRKCALEWAEKAQSQSARFRLRLVAEVLEDFSPESVRGKSPRGL
jgi:hypothetical protein